MPPIVLCIDDRPEMLKLRKTTLERYGYSVAMATNAVVSLRVLAKNQIAVVVVDYKSEGLDAQAVAYQVKQRYPAQPVILLSAYSEMPEAILWLVDDYVLRSESEERLMQVIERFARAHSASILRRRAAMA